jgi:site-specific DNA-methyltransferase (adenine-specific)
MNSALMFSKASDEWSTPQEFYDALHAEFHFLIDAAATSDNRKCRMYFGADHAVLGCRDALAVDWDVASSCPHWCNPPYSKCREFVAKAAKERRRGVLTVMLVPARTDTRWFHDYVWDRERHRAKHGIELRFIKGRLKFGGAIAGAPFPSMVVVFRP